MSWSGAHLEVRPAVLLGFPESPMQTSFRHTAAVFFCTYDTLKKTLPLPTDYAPVTHMLSASMGEVVRARQTALCSYLLMFPVKL